MFLKKPCKIVLVIRACLCNFLLCQPKPNYGEPFRHVVRWRRKYPQTESVSWLVPPRWRSGVSVKASTRTTSRPNNNPIFPALLVFWLLVFCAGVGQAQSLGGAAQSAPDDYTITQVNPDSCVWQNSSGQSVTAIETGMNFWIGSAWTASNPSFVVSPDGTKFVANQIQDPTSIAVNLNVQGAVGVTTPQNVALSSTPPRGFPPSWPL